MININCTSRCKHQKDGKCTMATASDFKYFDGKCAYFTPRENSAAEKEK